MITVAIDMDSTDEYNFCNGPLCYINYLPICDGEVHTRKSNTQTAISHYITPRTLQPVHKLFLHPQAEVVIK